jgi:sugar/nucleoside kinase (ribokinase family)
MIRKYALAIKYWLQGDDWKKAVEYANALTSWTHKRGNAK